MPVIRTYQCPDCNGFFQHMHMRVSEEPPARCPLCGADTSATAPELSAPHIAKTIGKVADQVYRDMETSSQHRAQLAADHLGEDVADQSAMRVTNLRDDARPGEIAAVAPRNEVTQFMAQTGQGGMADTSAAQNYAAATRVGPFAGAGMNTLDSLVKPGHARKAAQLIAAGTVGVHHG